MLKRQVEEALVALLTPLTADGQPLHGVPVVAGHRAVKKTLPCVVVYAERATAHDSFPTGSGVYEVTVRVFVLTQSDDEDLAAHEVRVGAVHGRLTAGAVETVNQLPDAGFRLYDLIETDAGEGLDGRHFGEVMGFTAVCQG
jgi:hypothetical protein